MTTVHSFCKHGRMVRYCSACRGAYAVADEICGEKLLCDCPQGVCSVQAAEPNKGGRPHAPPALRRVNVPVRLPLTEEEVKAMWESHRAALPRYLCFARAIERAHGIGDKDGPQG